ncbi:hypothetical protein ETB97_003198 [Aspergillus alliaceus]|uniref:Chaperonin 10-like protein n=1 Tax=Petromyces alliaceus TaxID=209559 RepID=A0A5N7CJ03_PETAA|nr:chaperonin 10-like protein [Aspergillus alliaceus]KAF5859186.1 hypothetical protein ETB97_003198 [Aspergillus burnettii]
MSVPNSAAWITAEMAYPLEVKDAPYPTPGDDELVIRNYAIGLNIVDWARQAMGAALFSWTTYPTVLGADVAGEVVEVGQAASSRFKPGDRVLSLARGLMSNNPAEGAFQIYVVLSAKLTTHIPTNVPFEEAAVIPLGIYTASCGLFQEDHLALQFPTEPSSEHTGETVLIWSGSSSVGSNAIQLAVAAGYEVFTTASPKNFDYVKSLGASQAFDYHRSAVEDEIVAAFKGKTSTGALAIGPTAADPCGRIVSRINGKKFVSLANHFSGVLPDGVESKFIFSIDSDIGPRVFEEYLPSALQADTFKPAPRAEVVGHGLESVQKGLDKLKDGVSATKLVISL